MAYVGASLASTADLAEPDTMELLVAQDARISVNKDYAIGGDGMITGVVVELLENTEADYTVVLPSTDASWPITGTHASAIVVSGEAVYTEDLSMS